MSINIVSFQKTPDSSYSIYKESKEKYRAILKGAAIEIPWEDERIVLRKLPRGWTDPTLTNKTYAKRNKLKISEVPVAYQFQNYDFRVILLYEIIGE